MAFDDLTQNTNNYSITFTGTGPQSELANPEARGIADGKAAYADAIAAGQRDGAIYFAVDIPGAKSDLSGIEEYFKGVHEGFDDASNGAPILDVGVYGAGITLADIKPKLATYSWLAETQDWTDSSPAYTLQGDHTNSRSE
jgi:hypothetical protein